MTHEFASFTTSSRGIETHVRKDSVLSFEISGSERNGFSLSVTYALPGGAPQTANYFSNSRAPFDSFRDQMLDTQAASAEELGKNRNSLSRMDAPDVAGEEPAFVTRDWLEITEGAEEFFKWLHLKYVKSEKIGCWSFKAVPGTQDEDFIVCHKSNTLSPPADVHISFRNHYKYARVCGIVVNDYYTPDFVGFNIILHEFVNNIVRPYAFNHINNIVRAYAFNHKITYNYSGITNEQPAKSNGLPGDTRKPPKETPRDSLRITRGAGSLRNAIAAMDGLPARDDGWTVREVDTQSVYVCNQSVYVCYYQHPAFGMSFRLTVSFDAANGTASVLDILRTDTGIKITNTQYNRCLERFVKDFVKPAAAEGNLEYEYSGDSAATPGENP